MSIISIRKPRPLLTVPLKYALVGGVLAILLFFVMLFFDENPLITNKVNTIILNLIFVFFSVTEYKKYYNNGILHFWEGMAVGFLTYFFIALISVLFIWSYLNLFNTELLHDYILNRTNLILNNKDNIIEQFGEETYRMALADIKLITPINLVWEDLKKILLVGFFITSVLAVIMRQVPVTEKNKTSK